MATGGETEAAFDNPLIPNARVRQIYLAMMQVRQLEQTLAAQKPKRAGSAAALGLEACLVSTSVDLGARDVVSDALAGGVVEFLRGGTLESVVRKDGTAKKLSFKANCGSAAKLPDWPGIEERLWAALGAASVLKCQRAQAKLENDGTTTDSGVAVVYSRLGDVTPALWRRTLAYVAEQELPVLFVVLPAAGRSSSVKPGVTSAIAMRHGIPGIAVDADDAVAIYRVAQEALGRTRMGGGAVLIECVPFVLEGARGLHKAAMDAIRGLEHYMLGRHIATKKWMERETNSFAARVSR
jgi:TPP-dependent pyruvate/acetoin dehydrogenase alpha subunit